MSTSKFRFNNLDSIGTADAEEDKFLTSCFVDTGMLKALEDCSDPRRIVVGRTGSGKTALLMHLAERQERVVSVRPEELALTYVSNSTILRFLTDLGVNLDIFFKLLWRHVLAVELLRKHFQLNSEKATVSWWEKLRAGLLDRRRTSAIEYLETWGSSFWEETDYRVREITQKLESDVQGVIKVGVGPIAAGAGETVRVTEGERAELVQRAQTVLDGVQIKQLGDVIQAIDHVLADPQKPYFIAIDCLDDDWIDDGLRYRLIRALIETLRDFRKVRHAKVVVAIRRDLIERVFRQTRGAGFQQEKYESLYLPVEWSRRELEELLDKRVQELVRHRYTKKSVTFRDVLPGKINRRDDAVAYILDRTLERPRDAIAFVNEAIKEAIGKATIPQQALKRAEARYSRSRIHALEDEWFGDFPNLGIAVEVVRELPATFHVAEIPVEACEKVMLSLLSNGSLTDEQKQGHIFLAADRIYEEDGDGARFRAVLVQVLYKVGLLWLKATAKQPWNHCTDGAVALEDVPTNDDVSLRVHATFARALHTGGER